MADARVKVREGRIELYRRVIREAAERVFGHRGPDHASIEEIAREAGIALGTLYRAFPDGKAGITTAIQEHRGAELLDHARQAGLRALEQHKDIVEAMLGGMFALVDYMVTHPDFLRLTLHLSWTWGNENQSVEQGALRNAAIEGAADAMRLGIATEAFIDRDPKLLARLSMAIQQTLLADWLERPRPAEEVCADLREIFLRLFCRPEELARRGVK
jgi:AcrR family transcriptional regulator